MGAVSALSAEGTYVLHTLFPYDIITIVVILLRGYLVYKKDPLSKKLADQQGVSMAVAIIVSLLVSSPFQY